ncbi:putative proteasome-type protease [Aliiruegeria haliotis]|uniref:Putative proteasome-type protease n=1 Tax=Aliiruegeria haliotis TaxID=1280846 RepID=A0A2T0RWF4_9RHOB|nr:proteasome-type protease [Aliiruegeria haliotis]PRY25383.1 putative proteasome-type protease [Aliiruegeria haliotis]
MTYCVGLRLNRGLVMMSDTRTNAGVDNISTFGKMHTWCVPGERMITLMCSGNLATTQAVVSLLEERSKAQVDRSPSILEEPSMFQVARLVGQTLREVIAAQSGDGQTAESPFGATLLIGGQIAPGPTRLFLVYPEGNFIEASEDTPFFQIGENKYGRPILLRAHDPEMSFEEAVKLLLVSFDSTLKANLSVGMPFDLQTYENDSFRIGHQARILQDDPYFKEISDGWGEALRTAFGHLPSYSFSEDPSEP